MKARSLALVPATAMVVLALAACSGGGGEAEGSVPPSSDGPTSTAEPTTPSSSPSDSGSGGATDVAGCAATDATVPENAAVGPTADLDGDGKPDELWLADDGNTRMLGVRTASGAVFSTDFTSAAPEPASAIGQVLGDGSAIVLLDTGRAVPLYAVVDCELVATQNAEGEQYTFDLGFTGYGTGVGCEDGGLVGYLADTSGDKTTVTTTAITLSDQGATAANGDSTTTSDLASDDPLVQQATSVTCGDNEPPVQEPQS